MELLRTFSPSMVSYNMSKPHVLVFQVNGRKSCAKAMVITFKNERPKNVLTTKNLLNKDVKVPIDPIAFG